MISEIDHLYEFIEQLEAEIEKLKSNQAEQERVINELAKENTRLRMVGRQSGKYENS